MPLCAAICRSLECNLLVFLGFVFSSQAEGRGFDSRLALHRSAFSSWNFPIPPEFSMRRHAGAGRLRGSLAQAGFRPDLRIRCASSRGSSLDSGRAAPTQRLTQTVLDPLAAAERRFSVMDTDVTGLGVTVHPGGKRTSPCGNPIDRVESERWDPSGRGPMHSRCQCDCRRSLSSSPA